MELNRKLKIRFYYGSVGVKGKIRDPPTFRLHSDIFSSKFYM